MENQLTGFIAKIIITMKVTNHCEHENEYGNNIS